MISLPLIGKSSLKPSPSTSVSPISFPAKAVADKAAKSLNGISLGVVWVVVGLIELIGISVPSVATIRKLAGI